MKKGNLFFLLILLLLVAGAYFFFQSSKSEIPNASFKRQFAQKLVPDSTFQSRQLENAYRLFPFRDSLLLLTPKGHFVIDRQLQLARAINDMPTEDGIYYADRHGDSLVTFDINSRTMTLGVDSTTRTQIVGGIPGNAIYNNGKFYFDQGDGKISGSETVITSWDPVKDRLDTLQTINKLAADHLMGYQDCLSQTLEGNFFKIDAHKTGYLFYYGGFFMVCDEPAFYLKPTVDKSPFRRYEIKTAQMPGGNKVTQCYAANSTHCNYAAASNGINIYILSGIISMGDDKELYAPVDVYDARNYSYRYTLRAPMKSISDFAYLMTVSGDHLYLYFKNNDLVRYKINVSF